MRFWVLHLIQTVFHFLPEAAMRVLTQTIDKTQRPKLPGELIKNFHEVNFSLSQKLGGAWCSLASHGKLPNIPRLGRAFQVDKPDRHKCPLYPGRRYK